MTSFTKVTEETPLQLSEAVTLAGFGVGTRLAHCTVMLPGQFIDGGVLSKTVIVCEHDAELPHSSVALYVRVTLNLLMQVRLVTTSLTKMTLVIPLQLSEAITVAVFGTGTWLAHCTLTLTGHVIDGGVLSNTVIV